MVIFQAGFFRVGVILGEHFPGRNCPVGIIQVAIFWVGVFLVPPLVVVSVLLVEMKKNPFFRRILLIHFALPFLFPLKTSENPRFSNTVWDKISSFDRAYGQMSYYSCFSME